jgi:hypothetical protein
MVAVPQKKLIHVKKRWVIGARRVSRPLRGIAIYVLPITYLNGLPEYCFKVGLLLEQGQVMSITNSSGSVASENHGPWQYVVEWVQSTRCRHELTMLSNRELSDMGLERIYPQEVRLHFTSFTPH